MTRNSDAMDFLEPKSRERRRAWIPSNYALSAFLDEDSCLSLHVRNEAILGLFYISKHMHMTK